MQAWLDFEFDRKTIVRKLTEENILYTAKGSGILRGGDLGYVFDLDSFGSLKIPGYYCNEVREDCH